MNAVAMLVGAVLSATPETWVDLVREGATCKINRFEAMECTYVLDGRDFLTIAGVGEGDPGVLVDRSELEGYAYVKLAPGTHRCVIIAAGMKAPPQFVLDVAFVSPFSGRVFGAYEECDASRSAKTGER